MGAKNSANLNTANTAARAIFDDVLNTIAPGPAAMFVDEYSTGSDRDSLVFGSALNAIREWTGAKEFGNFEMFSQSVVLTTYEDSFSLPRKFVDYDTTGAVGRMLSQKIEASLANADDKIIFDALVGSSGAGPTGFDALSLINDSHSLGGSTYDNKTTSALTFSTYDSGVQAMMGFKAANAEPLNVFPTHLVVGPKLRKQALEIAGNAERLVAVDNSGAESGTRVAASSIGNVFKGDNIDVVVWNRLTGTQDDYWYLMDLSKPSKPLCLKRERGYELIDQTDMDDPQRFAVDQYVWSIEGDLKVVAGAWPLIYAGIL